MKESQMKKELLDVASEYGTWNKVGKNNYFDFTDQEIDITWAYWDDNDDYHYDEDAYYKHLEGIENVNGELILHWDNSFDENFTSVDEDCQECIYGEIMDWRDWQQDEMAMENVGEGFQD